jgi:hypothetical protein
MSLLPILRDRPIATMKFHVLLRHTQPAMVELLHHLLFLPHADMRLSLKKSQLTQAVPL